MPCIFTLRYKVLYIPGGARRISEPSTWCWVFRGRFDRGKLQAYGGLEACRVLYTPDQCTVLAGPKSGTSKRHGLYKPILGGCEGAVPSALWQRCNCFFFFFSISAFWFLVHWCMLTLDQLAHQFDKQNLTSPVLEFFSVFFLLQDCRSFAWKSGGDHSAFGQHSSLWSLGVRFWEVIVDWTPAKRLSW